MGTKIRAAIVILFTTWGLSGAGQCIAQTWSGGIRVGTSIATFRGSSDTNFGYTASLAGGGSVSFWFTDMMSLRGEVLYAQRGGKTNNAIVDGIPSGFFADVTITYVDLPILLVARLPVSTPVVPSFYAGGAYGANVETLIILRSDTGVETRNADDTIASSDVFAVLGGALDFDVYGQRFVIDARASLGLRNVRPDRPDAPIRNTGFILTVGLDF